MYNLTVAGLQIGLIFFISPGPTLTLLLGTSASPLSLSLSLSFFSCLCLSLPTPCFILPFLYLSQSLSNRRGRCGFVRIGMVEGLWWTLALGCGIEESMVGLS